MDVEVEAAGANERVGAKGIGQEAEAVGEEQGVSAVGLDIKHGAEPDRRTVGVGGTTHGEGVLEEYLWRTTGTPPDKEISFGNFASDEIFSSERALREGTGRSTMCITSGCSACVSRDVRSLVEGLIFKHAVNTLNEKSIIQYSTALKEKE